MAAQNKLGLFDDVELAAGSTIKPHTSSRLVWEPPSPLVPTSFFDAPRQGVEQFILSREVLRRIQSIITIIFWREVIRAYSLGTELMGDKRHHVAHLVGEAIGATGLLQELRVFR
ncbi:hypothetical protein BKA61DRAFT_574282 [Leptodontidium sp. MPI-SDFR-AT-0119]|nr:hypothetical protein BKA61DRAFT_574282 [Leptodontidium sp. MPI-SDFR-AT-0119]